MITVAIDRDPEESRPYIERAAPTHPSLIDTTWLLADLYNIEQVPTVLWIDEEGHLVRPKDVTFGSNDFIQYTGVDAAVHRRLLIEWVREGKHLSPDRVLANMELPTDDDQLARAEFGLGRHLAVSARMTQLPAISIAPASWHPRSSPSAAVPCACATKTPWARSSSA